MHILIDNKNGAPIYDQIYTQIKAQIISGELEVSSAFTMTNDEVVALRDSMG